MDKKTQKKFFFSKFKSWVFLSEKRYQTGKYLDNSFNCIRDDFTFKFSRCFGILVGLIEGSENSAREYGSGDVVVSAFLNKSNIEHTPEIVDIVKTYPGYKSHTVRYIASARVSSDYRSTIKEGDIRNGAGGTLTGIDVNQEELLGFSKFVIRGETLTPTDFDSVLIGKNLLYEFTPIESPVFQTLKDVKIGDRVKSNRG